MLLAPLPAPNSSLSPLPTRSRSSDSDSFTTVLPNSAATATSVNITTLNITYGDHYGGAIYNGCVGGRRNLNEYHPGSRSDTPPPSPPPPVPPPPLLAVDGVILGLAFGLAGITTVLMLLRR
ncbi:hypothetical protein EYR40_009401 [Pleurotus pulmonarius]|nr:hypothetical protein EYR38_009498 [Pleurotus pulmonarius]KAF4590804.1 hypothetical protein EYR40_009401 [Pleurotus pulmonarius]